MGHRIRPDAGIVIAFQRGSHAVLHDGVVVLEDDRIVHGGREADGPVDETIDLRDRLLTPGFMNTHTHLSGSPLDKWLIEDVVKRQFQDSALPDMLPARAAANDRPMMEACVEYSMVELLRTGTTTVMEIGGSGDDVADAAACTGPTRGASRPAARPTCWPGTCVRRSWCRCATPSGTWSTPPRPRTCSTRWSTAVG